MRPHFPLFNTPLDLAHSFFEKLLEDGDCVIDATAGGGKDSLALALFLKKKKNTSLLVLDIQEDAINKTRALLEVYASDFLPSIHFSIGSHEHLPDISPKLVIYNLGYLPGGDKSLTTLTASTLASVKKALGLLVSGGVLSITCYPGHEEGSKELIALTHLLSSLDPKDWSFTSSTWHNRKAAPVLLLTQKIKKKPD